MIGETSKLNNVVPEIILQPALIVRFIGGPVGSPGPGGVEVPETLTVVVAVEVREVVEDATAVELGVLVVDASLNGSPGIGGKVSAEIDSLEKILAPAKSEIIPSTNSPRTINKTLEVFFFPETPVSNFSLFTLSPPKIMLETH